MNKGYNISQIKEGNQIEFRKLMDDNMDNIYTIAFRITASEEDARDIVQDTFVRLWEKRKTLKESGRVKFLLRKIAVNKSYDLLRKRKRNKTDSTDMTVFKLLAGGENADHKLNEKEALTVLRSLASVLSPKQRIVFTMVEMQELSHDEVAGITGMTKSSIKSNLNHAKRRMENLVDGYIK